MHTQACLSTPKEVSHGELKQGPIGPMMARVASTTSSSVAGCQSHIHFCFSFPVVLIHSAAPSAPMSSLPVLKIAIPTSSWVSLSVDATLKALSNPHPLPGTSINWSVRNQRRQHNSILLVLGLRLISLQHNTFLGNIILGFAHWRADDLRDCFPWCKRKEASTFVGRWQIRESFGCGKPWTVMSEIKVVQKQAMGVSSMVQN